MCPRPHGQRCKEGAGLRLSVCRASNHLSLPLLGSVGFQPKSLVGLEPRLFAVSSGNDKSLVLRIPAFTVRVKRRTMEARRVGEAPKLSSGNRVGVHLWIWTPHGEDTPVPNLLAQLTQPWLIPALVLLPGMKFSKPQV